MKAQALRYGLVIASIALAMGAKGGCGGTDPAEALCTKTGGTWDESSCPPTSWPPVCGGTVQAPAPGCGEDPVCKCPASKPFWVDGQGCWSEADCNKSCQGVATSCSSVSSCFSQDGCSREMCTYWKTCYDTRYVTLWCTEADRCYQYDTCYDSSGYSNDCGYYYDCSRTYDCGYYETIPYSCSYTDACGPCEGTATACSAYSTPQSCSGQAGCTWR